MELTTEQQEVAAFAASMPAEYRASFDHASVAAHAAIAKARGEKSTHVAIWRELPRMVGVCVVASDQPGLLSRISAALVAHDIEIMSANAYTRTRTDGVAEAFDLLWLRRMATAVDAHLPLGARDVIRVAEMVDALVSGRVTFPGAVRASRAERAEAAETRVRFDDGKDGTTVLTVEAVDRPGLLLAVTRTVFAAGLQIVGLRATTEGGRAIDRLHLAELDGKPLGIDRRLELQTAILAAMEMDILGG